MKQVWITIFVVLLAYFAFKRADAVQSIDFRGENYSLSEQYKRSGAAVYMYSPGGENALRAGKYIQVAHLPRVDMPADEYRRQYMETMKQANSFKKLTEKSFFFVEAKTFVHSALIQDGDRFKLYGYAEVQSDKQVGGASGKRARKSIAQEFEQTIDTLPQPPRSISTWF